MSGESGGIVGSPDHERAAILGEVIDAIRDGDPDRVGAEVMIPDTARSAIPASARVAEVADQFALLGIDANDGPMTALKAVTQLGEIFKRQATMGAGVGGDQLAIDA